MQKIIRPSELPGLAKEARNPKTLIPFLAQSDNSNLMAMAQLIAASEPVLLAGLVPKKKCPRPEDLATCKAELRGLINELSKKKLILNSYLIKSSYDLWHDLRMILSDHPTIEQVILDQKHLSLLGVRANDILKYPPCEVVLIQGPFSDPLSKILVANNGSLLSKQLLRLAITLARPSAAQVTSVFIRPGKDQADLDNFYFGMAQTLKDMPEVEEVRITSEDAVETLAEMADKFDLTLVGTSHLLPQESPDAFGPFADRLLNQQGSAAVILQPSREISRKKDTEFTDSPITVLVDRWFKENTFHSDEFADIDELIELKKRQSQTISLVLPALNEEQTIGEIIHIIQEHFLHKHPLLDELILMDSNSTDHTRKIAQEAGLPVYIHQEVLGRYGSRRGKGEALWKSLYVARGDLVFWVDTDIKNFHPRFVYGLVGPILKYPRLQFVKGFYRRPLKTRQGFEEGRGGRVTELTARPLINLFYPELSGVLQPLAGEYGGRRTALEQLNFTSGYGVETCLLLDVFDKFGLTAIGQVDLVERIHRNQSLANLSKMAFAVIQAMIFKLENRGKGQFIQDINRTMKLIKYVNGEYRLDVETIAELPRPPMLNIPEYRIKFNKQLK